MDRALASRNKPATALVPTAELYTWVDLGDDKWQVTDTNGEQAVVAVLAEEKAVVVLSGDAGIVPVFADSPELGFELWQTQAGV